MSVRKILLAAAIVALVIVIFFSWLAWNDAQFGWAHVVGMGATLLLLLIIWFWPRNWMPTEPPP
jgi:O-antigen/teichoic acid export membrane protein